MANNYYRLNEADKVKLMELEIAARERALNLFEDIRKLFRNYDGRKVTKRLDTALKKIDPNLWLYQRHNTIEVRYYNRINYINLDDGTREYTRNGELSIFSECKVSGTGDGVLQDGVFRADIACAALARRKESFKAVIEKARADLKRKDAIINRYAELNKAIEDFNTSQTYMFRAYFGTHVS